jgi:hypothetical protein
MHTNCNLEKAEQKKGGTRLLMNYKAAVWAKRLRCEASFVPWIECGLQLENQRVSHERQYPPLQNATYDDLERKVQMRLHAI